MAFAPKEIKKEHVLKAISKIEEQKINLKPSTRWSVEINEKKYPPKEVMRYAHEEMNGEKIWEYGGGEATNSFLIKMGFAISEKNADPIKELIEKYKRHIEMNGLDGEVYKWKLVTRYRGRPNVDAADFYQEVYDTDFSNLIYGVGKGAIRHLAADRTESYRDCMRALFNENIPLNERIKTFFDDTLKLYRELIPDERLSHHQDERTMATFLTYHNPDKYTFFKDSFYQQYCKLLGIKPKWKGEKYVHYLELVDDLITNYINDDQQLLGLAESNIPQNYFQDPNHLLLAQDILYQTLDKRLGIGRNYWRVGTKEGNTSYWDNMKAGHKISIGWPELGDLYEQGIDNREDIAKRFRDEGYYQNDPAVLSRKAGEVFNFYKGIGIGDVVLAQDGHAILSIGVVTDEYLFDDKEAFPHQHQVKWLVEHPPFKNSQGNLTTVYRLDSIALIDQIDKLLKEKRLDLNLIDYNGMSDSKNVPLNQLLFGPPGTGKTYNTVSKALEILRGNIQYKSRQEEKMAFNEFVKKGQIVFTTFHQSMSYEDFIEGIKPLEPEKEGGTIIYKVVDGVFKKACAMAAFNCYKLFNQSKQQQHSSYTFDDLYDAFINSVQEKINNQNKPVYRTLRGKEVEIKEINSNNSIIARPKNSTFNSPAPLTKENLQKLYDTFNGIDEIQDLKQVKNTVQVTPRITEFYAVFKGLKEFEETYKPDEEQMAEAHEADDFDPIEIQKKFNDGVFNEAVKKYGGNAEHVVFIIDEINRGNVSQIFGELITLIEEDKRLGMDEALEVTLPYSKKPFGVPPNLYIIGTMNTADRSVEALDTALRRRFSFQEMPPKPELIKTEGALKETDGWVEGISLVDVLETINKRIEKLLDKDHLIGHSYFMCVKNIHDLQLAFKNKIIPLLQEYFFGDYGKIGLVLGKGFVKAFDEIENKNIFADFEQEIAGDFEERVIYKFTDVENEQAFKLALQPLLKQ